MNQRTLAVARAVGIIAATFIVVTGITIAAFTSNSVTLANDQLASATASLQIKSVGSTFASTDTGFNFTGLAPNIASAPFTFSLDNTGGVPLTISATSGPLAPTNFDPTQVTLHFVNLTDSNAAQDYPLSQLATGIVLPGAPIGGTAISQYSITATMAPAAVNGSGGGVAPFTITLTGTSE